MEIDGGSDKIGERPTKVVANQTTKKVRLKEVEMEFDAESDGGPQHGNLISFTDKLILRMAQFVVLRLLSKKIGYNGMVDYTKALSEGLWVIYGHYLTVHPWNAQAKYSAIGGMVGKVIKIDYNIDQGTRGWLA
ncbi:hypothetical protein Gogos_010387 [Gossypium gossypioides]|uniref:Uncharacterized protein n=1 Tax=Gossypium gossypioides TaxID=34282 RepID=A0A7J9BL78_GOSGO|nr:hypothetical protein [Gossypium gossypioides]